MQGRNAHSGRDAGISGSDESLHYHPPLNSLGQVFLRGWARGTLTDKARYLWRAPTRDETRDAMLCRGQRADVYFDVLWTGRALSDHSQALRISDARRGRLRPRCPPVVSTDEVCVNAPALCVHKHSGYLASARDNITADWAWATIRWGLL